MKQSTLLLILAFVACASVALADTGCTATAPCKTVWPEDLVQPTCYFYNRTIAIADKITAHYSLNANFKSINMLAIHGMAHWPIWAGPNRMCQGLSGNSRPTSGNNAYTTINNYAHQSTESLSALQARTYATLQDLYEITAYMFFITDLIYINSGLLQDAYPGSYASLMTCLCDGSTTYTNFNGYGLGHMWNATINPFYDIQDVGHLNPFPGEGVEQDRDTMSTTIDQSSWRDRLVTSFLNCMYVHREVVTEVILDSYPDSDYADCADYIF